MLIYSMIQAHVLLKIIEHWWYIMLRHYGTQFVTFSAKFNLIMQMWKTDNRN